MNLERVKQVLKKVNALIENLDDQGQTSAIERDLLLRYLRDLYEDVSSPKVISDAISLERENHLNEIAKKYNVTPVGLDEIYDVNMDIYAPCALGATVNDDTLNRLNCKIIAGAANNQLENEEIHGTQCTKQGILFAPDFLINSGGLMNVYSDLTGSSHEEVMKDAEKIYDYTLNIFNKAEKENIYTQKAAILTAQERIDKAK